ncbi:MAG: polysaccharide deacetylase family protein [Candidatus Caenarcaniphilales bacterium]|nr:polysaccharide deacetylase family protein [Candidatus Caenarcaniphilales bacterium]
MQIVLKPLFFVLGDRIQTEKEKEVLRKAHQHGHEIQLHGINQHRAITKYKDEEILQQLELSKTRIETAIKQKFSNDKTWYFRPPWGAMNNRTTSLLKKNNYKIVIGDVLISKFNFANFRTEEPYRPAVRKITNSTKGGSIIILHVGQNKHNGERTWDSPATAKTLDKVIQELSQEFEFVTLSELLK